MFKRRLVRWGLVMALVLLAGASVLWFQTGHGTASRIHLGMTYAEIDNVVAPALCDSVATGSTLICFWDCQDGHLIVYFAGDLKAAHIRFTPKERDWLTRLRAWLGW
jgi:hypothetical protein